MGRLERLFDRVDARTERFDDWESCLSWLPLTEAGDVDQDLGYLVDEGLWPYERVHYPAVDVDHSEWDDPDYQVLAFRGQDHPFGGKGECGTDPGEAPDRLSQDARDRPTRLRSRIRALRDDVEDLGEPVFEITTFDQCMYTLGFRDSPGYLYRSTRRQADSQVGALLRPARRPPAPVQPDGVPGRGAAPDRVQRGRRRGRDRRVVVELGHVHTRVGPYAPANWASVTGAT